MAENPTSEADTYEMLPQPEQILPPTLPPPPVRPLLNECPECGYDLRGSNSNICPECGKSHTEALLDAAKRTSLIDDLFCFRWVVYCVAPVLIWIPVAWGLSRFAGAAGMSIAWTLGIVTALASAAVAGRQASEECSMSEGLGLVAVVVLVSGGINLGLVGFLAGLL